MKQNLIDQARFRVQGGSGGDGSVSFRRVKYVTKGGPDGGDGGRGGTVWLETDPHVSTLRFYAGKDRFEAKKGERGTKRDRIGHNSEDLVLIVPVGTVVKVRRDTARMLKGNEFYGEYKWQEVESDGWQPFANTEKRKNLQVQTVEERFGVVDTVAQSHSDTVAQKPEGERLRDLEIEGEQGDDAVAQSHGDTVTQPEPDWLVVADMTEPGMRLELAKGGKGGRGNARFKSSRLTTPKFAERGEVSERFEVQLELKVLANVGLVGMPSVGKSMLLSVLSNAKPEIADYPFTTLSPNLGVLESNQHEHILTVADIPGLIEGAHEGKGLGVGFLKHVERCKILAYILAPELNPKFEILNSKQMAEDLWQQYQMILHEVRAYDPGMLEKESLVAVNKMDLVTSDWRLAISDFFSSKGIEVTLVSAATREGLEELVGKLTNN